MKDFVKLNIVSVIYALLLFISMELLINVYRINRVTGWNFDVILLAIPLIIILNMYPVHKIIRIIDC